MLTLYGRALLQDDHLDLAERTLQRAATKYPLEPSALFWLAMAAERLNHVEAARRALIDYNALVDNDGKTVERASRIASLSLRLHDPRTAVQWLRRASGEVPADARVTASLADAELRAGDRQAARDTIARGLAKDANNPALLALARRAR